MARRGRRGGSRARSRSPWGHLITASQERPVVEVAGRQCILIGCSPRSGRAKVMYHGRHYFVPASTVRLPDPT